ncbi:MAG: transglutaminase domain-containing protein [Myxococcota bacterium]
MTPTKAQWVERSPLWVALGAAAWAGFLGVLWVIPVLWVGERQGRLLQAALGLGWMALMWGLHPEPVVLLLAGLTLWVSWVSPMQSRRGLRLLLSILWITLTVVHAEDVVVLVWLTLWVWRVVEARVRGPRRYRLGVLGFVGILSVALFAAVPRPVSPQDVAMTGLGDDLGEALDRDLVETSDPVARVTRPDGGELRPIVLRERAWSMTDEGTFEPLSATEPYVTWRREGAAETWRVTDVLGHSEHLLLPGPPQDIQGVIVVARDEGDAALVASRDEPRTYDVVVSTERGWGSSKLTPGDKAAMLRAASPDEELAPRFREALGPAGVSQQAQVHHVMQWLGQHHDYTRQGLNGEDGLERFLKSDLAGSCVPFAMAAVWILREGGIPSRVVTGYAGGRLTDEGWVFEASHAHAWVEVHEEGVGWLAVDPTAWTSGTRDRSSFADVPVPPTRSVSEMWRAWMRSAWATGVVGFDAAYRATFWRMVWRAVSSPVVWGGLLLWFILRARRRRAAVANTTMKHGHMDGVEDRVRVAFAQARQSDSGVVGSTGPWLSRVPERPDEPRWRRWLRRLVWVHYEVDYGHRDAADGLSEADELLGRIRRDVEP